MKLINVPKQNNDTHTRTNTITPETCISALIFQKGTHKFHGEEQDQNSSLQILDTLTARKFTYRVTETVIEQKKEGKPIS